MALPGPLTNIIIMPHLVRKKLNNHFIMSQKMIDRGMIKDFEILEDGANMLDHLPVLMRASIQFPSSMATMCKWQTKQGKSR